MILRPSFPTAYDPMIERLFLPLLMIKWGQVKVSHSLYLYETESSAIAYDPTIVRLKVFPLLMIQWLCEWEFCHCLWLNDPETESFPTACDSIIVRQLVLLLLMIKCETASGYDSKRFLPLHMTEWLSDYHCFWSNDCETASFATGYDQMILTMLLLLIQWLWPSSW